MAAGFVADSGTSEPYRNLASPGTAAMTAESQVEDHRMSVRLVSYGFVAALAGLLTVSMAANVALRLVASRNVIELNKHWVPAQASAVSLLTAYVDEETGNRGFLLTGAEPFVARLESGERSARRLQTRLHSLLKDDRVALAELHQVAAAHLAWQTMANQEIGTRRAGPLSPERAKTMVVDGKQRFDTLRTRLAALTDHVS